jgi:hypothetical protein
MKLYVAFITQGGDRARHITGRTVLNDTAMPVFEADIKLIEDEIERRTGSDVAFITFMHPLEEDIDDPVLA